MDVFSFKNATPGVLLFRIRREACPIFLDLKLLSRLIFLDLVFCLYKFIFLCSHMAERLYFWINLAHNKEELNEDLKWTFFKAMLSCI